jgi:hypothetical protein
MILSLGGNSAKVENLFLKHADSNPDPKKIISDPHHCYVPSTPHKNVKIINRNKFYILQLETVFVVFFQLRC